MEYINDKLNSYPSAASTVTVGIIIPFPRIECFINRLAAALGAHLIKLVGFCSLTGLPEES